MQALKSVSKMRRPSTTILASLAILALALLHANRGSSQELASAAPGSKAENQWRGVHIMSPARDGLPLLKRAIAEKLAPMGVNALIVEVNYYFVFKSHAELSGGDNALRALDARELAETCRKQKFD